MRDGVERILGFGVSTGSLESCLDTIEGWLDGSRAGRYLVCANPHSLEVARMDEEFAAALLEADLVVPDGVGILLASRILGGSIRRRITGMDLFEGLCARLDRRVGASCFFLGSSPGVLEAIAARLARDYPGLRLAGTWSPPFKARFSEEDDGLMVEAVRAAAPDVLWVGMTAPKQEKWILAHRAQLGVAFIGAVGAVFDFYAGTVRRSSPWFRRHGLEWLPRLVRQPGRLWRRNLVSNPRFLLRVLAARLRAGLGAAGR